MTSEPFDIGITCRKGIGKIRHHQPAYMQQENESELKPIFSHLFA